MSLSERVRPASEAAPWVIKEIIALEAERDQLRDAVESYLEILSAQGVASSDKLRAALKEVGDE